MTKIFITGGHYTPAKAVIDELVKSGQWEIFYVGKRFSFEGDQALAYEFLELEHFAQVHFLAITTGRLQRKFSSQTLVSLAKIPIGFGQSFWWLVHHRPAVILSFGGYIALPVALAGWLLGIPVVTHEQTTTFGLANRVIQVFAHRVLVSFTICLPVKPNRKWSFVGNPVRNEVSTINWSAELTSLRSLKAKIGRPVIYVTGGKQGSHLINNVVLKELPALVEQAILIWQTGDNRFFRDYEAAREKLNSLPEAAKERVFLTRFISGEAIGAVFKLSDLVVSRAGANIIFDLALLGKPAVLIPIPWASGNEQRKNAAVLAKYGGVKVLNQESLSADFMPTTAELLANLLSYRKKALAAKELVVGDSAERIVSVISKEAHKKE